jgi:hypothetical protein
MPGDPRMRLQHVTQAWAQIHDAAPPGTFSAHAGRTYLALGRAFQAQGKNDEALANFRLAAEHLEKSLGNEHAESRAARNLATQLLGGRSALN